MAASRKTKRAISRTRKAAGRAAKKAAPVVKVGLEAEAKAALLAATLKAVADLRNTRSRKPIGRIAAALAIAAAAAVGRRIAKPRKR